jgi:hypothetical protein
MTISTDNNEVPEISYEKSYENNHEKTEVVVTDIVKLASAKKSLTKKVADWQDRIIDAGLTLEDSKANLVQNLKTMDIKTAEMAIQEWRSIENKVARLDQNLGNYKQMLLEATNQLRAAI